MADQRLSDSWPVVSHDVTVWKDASAGVWRLLAAGDEQSDPQALFTGADEFDLRLSPRMVSTADGDELILVAAEPAGFIIRLDHGEWTQLADDIPEWTSSAAVREGELILIGNPDGKLVGEIRAFDRG